LTTYDYDGIGGAVTANQYEVDGDAVAEADFEFALNEGDTVEIETSDTGVRTHSLTNQTVSGMVESSSAAGLFTIGELGDNPATAQDAEFTSVGANSVTIDGEVATVAAFNADLSVGDQATYARDNDIVTITLVNNEQTDQGGELIELALDPDGAGPLVATGAGPADAHNDGGTLALLDEDGPFNVDYPPDDADNDPVFLVDGVVSTEEELEDDLTAGDLVVVREADEALDTEARVSLTNTSLSGFPDDIDTLLNLVSVVGQDDATQLAADIDYTTDYFGGGDVIYVVDGDEVLLAAWEAALVNDVDDDSVIEIRAVESEGGSVLATEYRLTTE
jgi:hypothetical protein